MAQDIELGCRCGEIHGSARGVSPDAVNRVVCYCDDCQAFLHHLGRADLLDAHGGTDVVQVAPNVVAFDKGTEQIACVRLSKKGMYRWYASCCQTPLGNTLTPSVPFIGMPVEVFRGAPDAMRRDAVFGKPRGTSFVQFAVGGAPEGATGNQLGLLLRMVLKVFGWKLRGKTWPHPYFDRDTRKPSRPVTLLTREERDALRPKCGPNPTL
jgi:hypothetical protein